MGHPAKHPIDPDTGLCDICDRDAIRDLKLGRRPARRILYVDRDDRVIEQPVHEEKIVYVHEDRPYVIDDDVDDVEPQYVSRTMPVESAVRTRRVIYEQPVEEPMVIRRHVVRRDRVPTEQVVVRRRDPVPTTHYYVEREGHRIPRVSSPPQEIVRRHVVQYRSPPPPSVLPPVKTRAVRVISKRAVTPPPVVVKTYRPSPRRQTNSDTQIIEREQRIRREELYDETPVRVVRPEMYHLDTVYADDDFSRLNTPEELFYDDPIPPPPPPPPPSSLVTSTKTIHQNGDNRHRTKVERVEHHDDVRPIPTVVKRSYKQVPSGKEPPLDSRRSVNGKSKGTKGQVPRQYASSPLLSTDRNRDPAIYYIRSGGGP